MSKVKDLSFSWFGDWINRRIKAKRNFLMAVVGETGSGKSYLALRLAEKFDRNGDFNVDHVVFTPSDFLDCVNRLGNHCFIVVDEAGLMFSHRDYASMVNKMLGFVLQSFRYKYLNCIFTLPNLGFMDYVGRSLMHCVIRMLDHGYGAVYRVQKDQLGRRTYFPKIGYLKTDLPSEAIVRAYEEKKARIMDERYRAYKVEIEAGERSFRFASPVDIVKYIKENALESVLKDGDRFDAVSISAHFDINITKAYIVKKMLEKGVLEKPLNKETF